MAPERKTNWIGVSDINRVAGESHPHAKLTDAQVDEMRDLHEDEQQPMSYRQLAKRFGVPLPTVRSICSYRRRSTAVVRVIRRK